MEHGSLWLTGHPPLRTINVDESAVVGLDGYVIEVEVDISPGLPSFTIVGLPDTAVQEARERARAATRNSGCGFPMRRRT